jgi:hypothetical protein
MNIDGCAIANVMNPELLQDAFALFGCHDDKRALLHLDLLFGRLSEPLGLPRIPPDDDGRHRQNHDLREA